jgi:hypothetical protein
MAHMLTPLAARRKHGSAPTVVLAAATVAPVALQVYWIHRFRFGFVTEWDESGYVAIALHNTDALRSGGLFSPTDQMPALRRQWLPFAGRLARWSFQYAESHGQQPAVASARSLGFKPVRRFTLPDGRTLTMWWRAVGTSATPPTQ